MSKGYQAEGTLRAILDTLKRLLGFGHPPVLALEGASAGVDHGRLGDELDDEQVRRRLEGLVPEFTPQELPALRTAAPRTPPQVVPALEPAARA